MEKVWKIVQSRPIKTKLLQLEEGSFEGLYVDWDIITEQLFQELKVWQKLVLYIVDELIKAGTRHLTILSQVSTKYAISKWS